MPELISLSEVLGHGMRVLEEAKKVIPNLSTITFGASSLYTPCVFWHIGNECRHGSVDDFERFIAETKGRLRKNEILYRKFSL